MLTPKILPDPTQENQTEQCKDMISCLPREKGWIEGQYLHLYQGFWHPTSILQGVIACQKNFQGENGDTLIVTPWKSGTTWLKAITFALINRAQLSPDLGTHPLLDKNPHLLVQSLEIILYANNQVPLLNSNDSPRIFSTHMPINSLPESVHDSDACKVVYLCRNPKDVLVSLWHFSNKLRPPNTDPISLEEAFEKFCRGVSVCGPLWDHILGYWKESLKNPQKVLFLKYEELKRQPNANFKKLAEFLGCPFSPEEEAQGMGDKITRLCSFDNLSKLEANKSGKLPSGEVNSAFFRRGKVGDWVNYITPEMAKKLDCITRDKLHGSGLIF